MGEQFTSRLEGVAPEGDAGPWFLRPDDWRRARHASANVLLVGAAPSMTDVLEGLSGLQKPIVTWRAGERFSPPTANCPVGTMILIGIEALPPADQQRLYQWLQRRSCETQVISVTSRPLLPLVEQGAFHDGLYYRLNTVCVEVGGHTSDGDVSSWLRADLLAGDGGNGLTSDGWTLRVKPDRRRVQVPMAPGADRRRR